MILLSRCLVLALACAAGAAQGAQGVRLDDPGLTLVLPELEGLARLDTPIGDLKAVWTGLLGECEVRIQVAAIEGGRFPLSEPEDVSVLAEGHHLERLAREGVAASFGRRDSVAGSFGWIPYACLVQADLQEETAVDGRLWLLCGLSERAAWFVQIEARPLPRGEAEQALVAFLRKGVSADGKPRDWRWTEEEVRTRWAEFAPEDALKKLEDPLRTKHYIVLTNSSGGKAFARKMEECYDTIQALFPFPEVEGRKLMPVFLFRTPDQYYAYFSKVAEISLEEARRSKGHAWRDYYATWYEAPGDPVHIHEATHQIFGNRLMLSGGGSWFQEGVAEYVETRDNERNEAARLVKKRRHTPLSAFVQIESLLMSAGEDKKGGNEAGDHYKQAALLIEFLRESRFGKERFQDFVHAVGRLDRGDLSAIQGAVGRVYGVSLDELEEQWVAYCQKR